ncbi:MAG TPA: hypothetical protein VFD01_04535 [Candidatus Dormibacteraeota bacterium]|nr:hypothetical protein [Candidatus Dormibacteraeota bacterium]
MPRRLEEEPDDEPEAAPATVVPSVPPEGQEYEYRTEVMTADQVLDGVTLPDQLTRAAADGWELVDVIAAGERHAVLLRRARRPNRAHHPVGFAPPAR